MGEIMNRENNGVSVHGNWVNNLRFADNIDIIEQSNEKLQHTVDKLVEITYIKWTIWNAYKYSKDKDHGLWEKSQKRMMLKWI